MTETLDIQEETITGKYQPDAAGFYGDFGGAFIPEMLYHNVETLRKNYLKITNSKEFQKQFQSLLKDYELQQSVEIERIASKAILLVLQFQIRW